MIEHDYSIITFIWGRNDGICPLCPRALENSLTAIVRNHVQHLFICIVAELGTQAGYTDHKRHFQAFESLLTRDRQRLRQGRAKKTESTAKMFLPCHRQDQKHHTYVPKHITIANSISSERIKYINMHTPPMIPSSPSPQLLRIPPLHLFHSVALLSRHSSSKAKEQMELRLIPESSEYEGRSRFSVVTPAKIII